MTQNVLGIISDFVLEVDAIDICMVFSVIKNGVKLSFRSCIKEVSASEMAQEVQGHRLRRRTLLQGRWIYSDGSADRQL